MTLEIERVETKKQLKQFISVPWEVYKNDPNWVPWLFFERLAFFDKKKNPFFEHAEADYFIARRNGKAVGTIAAVLNHRHNEIHEENTAHFGVFELFNDPEAAALLLETACDWARDRGTDRIIGPANLSSTMEWGMLFDGYDSPPVVLMTYNPPYYNELVEANGFEKVMDLYAWNNRIADRIKPGGFPEKVYRVVSVVKKRYKLSIRPIDMKQFDRELDIVKKVYNSAWEKNWGFIPLTDAEFDSLVGDLKPILDPRIVFVVEADGEPVGFSLSFPDVNQLLLKYRPGPTVIGSYIAAARMMLNKTKTNRLRVFALGVLEKYRGRGVDALMYYETVTRAVPLGYEWAEGSWVLETNDAANRVSEMVGSDLYKRYRLYVKDL
ncbi:MAG: N-acetyltransferase [Candidatus Promineifilaceae bacterium]